MNILTIRDSGQTVAEVGGQVSVNARHEHSGPDGRPIQIQVQALLGLIENPVVMERLSDV
jgi:hypothetical protein